MIKNNAMAENKRKPTHAEVIEFCELLGADHTNENEYNVMKDDLELEFETHSDKSVKEIVEWENGKE
jgi:hypothetical protein